MLFLPYSPDPVPEPSPTLLRFPKMPLVQQPQNQLSGFQSFIFNDNFTKHKIVVKDLESMYSRKKGKKTIHLQHSRHREEPTSRMPNNAQNSINGLMMYKKFQIECVRNRDMRYRIPTATEQSECKLQEDDDKSFRFKSVENARRVSQSKMRLRQYLTTSQSQSIQQQEPKKLQFKQQEEYEQNSRLKEIEKDFVSRMHMYVKRTIQESGQYLIQPTLEAVKRRNLLKPNKYLYRETIEKKQATRRSEVRMEEPTKQMINRALELTKLMRVKDQRSISERKFAAELRKGDAFNVSQLLVKKPKLMETVDSKGNTVMHEAAKIDNYDLFNVLLEKGGRKLLTQPNHIGQTALDILKHFGNMHLLQNMPD